MDKTMKNLQGRFDELSRQANAMVAEKGDAVWTDAEQADFNNLVDQMNGCKAQMKSIEALREAEADKFFAAAVKPADGKEGVSFAGAFEAMIRKGIDNISAEERGVLRPQNVLAKGTDADGGYTVPEELARYVIEQLKAFGGMREAANVMSTDSGITMKWPTSNGTAEVGEIVAENAQISELNPTFGLTSLDVYKYSSKSIRISWELLQDTGINIVQFITNRLATRIARIQNQHFTVGTGTNQPEGLVTAAAKNTANVVSGTVSYDSLVDLMHAIDPAYRNNCAWMMSDKTLAAVRKLKDDNKRPIWGADNLIAGAPDSLLGKRIIINQDMPDANPIAYGDFGSYTIRDVRSSIIMRRFDDSKYAEYGQAGFCKWMRSGGALLVPSGVALLKVGSGS